MKRSILETKLAKRVIAANANGIRMNRYAKENNLNKVQVKQILVDFVCCGKNICLNDFLLELSKNG